MLWNIECLDAMEHSMKILRNKQLQSLACNTTANVILAHN